MSAEIPLAYGADHLTLTLPRQAEPTIFTKTSMAPLPDPQQAVWDALAEPVGSAPLSQLARGRTAACIVVCDVTRPVPNGLLLRPLIETMIKAGMPADGITVLVATGLHRPNVGPELAGLIDDPWVQRTVRVENHDARDPRALVDLGRTSTRGTPIQLNRRFVEAELRIVTGLVEPHFMAGWSGGRKVVAPGIAGQETIRTFHSFRFMDSPQAVPCNLVGNPLHAEQLEIVAAVGEICAVNTVLDEQRRLLHVNFGEVRASHDASVAVAERVCQVSAHGRQYSTVVTSAGGSPLDQTYYQTIKGMVTPLEVLAPGGTLIIASACAEGLGSAEFVDAQRRLRRLGPERFLRSLADKPLADVDEWQTQMLVRSLRVGRVELYSDGLDAADLGLTEVEPVTDLSAAVQDSIERTGDPSVAVIPDGPYTIPVR